jgi:hypothetical protein
MMLSLGGILLTFIWYFNNLKIASYVRYWWLAIKGLEEKFGNDVPVGLVRDYEKNCEMHGIARHRYLRYSNAINTIPLLFLTGWIWIFVMSARMAAAHVVQGFGSNPTGRESVETQRETPRDLGPVTRLRVPNNFYSPGIVFGVDADGNSYVLADLTREAKIEKIISEGPAIRADFGGTFRGDELERIIGRNAQGDVVSRALQVVKRASEKMRPLKEVVIEMRGMQSQFIQQLEVERTLSDTEFWRERRPRLQGLRLFLVQEAIGAREVDLTFPDADSSLLRSGFNEMVDTGEGIRITSEKSIQVRPRSFLILAVRVVELSDSLAPKASEVSVPHVVPVSEASSKGSLSGRERSSSPQGQQFVPEVVPLASTHFAEAPNLASLSRQTTYGDILSQLESRIVGPQGAGFNEVRIYDSGMGFALATQFEVTAQDGVPLKGIARFQPAHAAGNRLRGFYITVAAHPGPAAYVSTRHIEELFSMKYGMPYLPDDMAQIPIEPGTAIRVFVVEFDRYGKSASVRELPPSDCPRSAQVHLVQSGIVK